MYNERLKRLKQDKSKAQYEEPSDSEEEGLVSINGKKDNSNKIQEEETEISKIQRDLEILNRQIQEDLEERKRKGVKLSFS